MSKIRLTLNLLGLVVLTLTISSLAQAQATRTWVSGVGDDANPCSRTAPCKTFAGAISKTAAGGEINAIDPGGFGGITITKSITIDGASTHASILASGGVNAVVVNAGASDKIVLRNLSINGAGTTLGTNGVNFLAGGQLSVQSCNIMNFSNMGIKFDPANGGQLIVSNTNIRNITTAGIGIQVLSGSNLNTSKATIDETRVENMVTGFQAGDNARVTIRNSSATGCSSNGFRAVATSQTAVMNLENCLSTHNVNGIAGEEQGAGLVTLRFSNCVVVQNTGTGLVSIGGAQVLSFQNNKVDGNGANGAPTGTIDQL
jgi:hypothetical protein